MNLYNSVMKICSDFLPILFVDFKFDKTPSPGVPRVTFTFMVLLDAVTSTVHKELQSCSAALIVEISLSLVLNLPI